MLHRARSQHPQALHSATKGRLESADAIADRLVAVGTAARRAVLVVEQHEADGEGAEGEGRKACPQRQVYHRQIQSYPRQAGTVRSTRV